MFRELFEKQSAYALELRKTGPSERIKKLKALKRALQAHEQEIYAALQDDLRKSTFEAALTEVVFVYGELDYAIARLKSWMRPKRAGRSVTTFFAKSRIISEPKGVCLILAPWNYPFQLVISPLISAIAAGNCVFVKPSEMSPATSSLLSRILQETFEPQELLCVEGGKEVASALLELPFDHIFFTGSSHVGKIVMAAAAKHLASCTLELGGKSPAVISEHADISAAAERIIWGKLVNAGQTCIAPDYVLVQAGKQQEFIDAAKSAILRMIYSNGDLDKNSYCRIINKAHYTRLENALDEALHGGAVMQIGGCKEPEALTIAPVILTQLPEGCSLLNDEIFGPILPVLSYEHLEEAISYINARPKPLAAYLFSQDSGEAKAFVRETSAGGTCINDVLVHISSPKLPFGGVGNSGMGSSHGYYGFKAFSHERSVMYQSSLSFSHLVYPPYHKKSWIINLLKKL